MTNIYSNPAHIQPVAVQDSPLTVLSPDTAHAIITKASDMTPNMLQNIMSNNPQDQFANMRPTNNGTQTSFNTMSPSQAYANSMQNSGSYYSPENLPVSMRNMMSNTAQSQQYMQQQGVGDGMPVMASNVVDGAENLTPEELKTKQLALIKKNLDNWNDAMTLWSNIASAEHILRQSIIQNIR